MLPLVGIPKTVEKFLKQYRQVFRKEAGFKDIKPLHKWSTDESK